MKLTLAGKVPNSDAKETNQTKRKSTQTEKKTDWKSLKGFTLTDNFNLYLEPVGGIQLRYAALHSVIHVYVGKKYLKKSILA